MFCRHLEGLLKRSSPDANARTACQPMATYDRWPNRYFSFGFYVGFICYRTYFPRIISLDKYADAEPEHRDQQLDCLLVAGRGWCPLTNDLITSSSPWLPFRIPPFLHYVGIFWNLTSAINNDELFLSRSTTKHSFSSVKIVSSETISCLLQRVPDIQIIQ